MKKIVCELCDGTEFKKENGMFVCQGCGTIYPAEEVKNMMREVEDDVPTSSGVFVGNPNQQQIDNLLLLATNAYSANNNKEAENYCNRAIELDAMSYNAWFLKGKAIGWQSSLSHNRMEEAAYSFCQAIEFAPEDEKEDLKNQALGELKALGLAGISLRCENFVENPSNSNRAGFIEERKALVKASAVFVEFGYHFDDVNIEGQEDYRSQTAIMMSDAAVSAMNKIQECWNELDHPSESDFDTYLNWIGNVKILLESAINLSDDDDEEDIERYRSLITAIQDPIDKSSYSRQWVPFANEYRWLPDQHLTNQAISNRKEYARDCENKIADLQMKISEKRAAEARKEAEEKQMRVDAYWEAHADEKTALEAEKKQLSDKKATLDDEIAELDKIISAAREDKEAKVPSEEETDRLKAQIKELENRRANLGLFSGKEKKQIGEEIDSLRGRIDSLRSRIDEEKKTRSEEVAKKLNPALSKRAELNSERGVVTKRISAIDAELTKDPQG